MWALFRKSNFIISQRLWPNPWHSFNIIITPTRYNIMSVHGFLSVIDSKIRIWTPVYLTQLHESFERSIVSPDVLTNSIFLSVVKSLIAVQLSLETGMSAPEVITITVDMLTTLPIMTASARNSAFITFSTNPEELFLECAEQFSNLIASFSDKSSETALEEAVSALLHFSPTVLSH